MEAADRARWLAFLHGSINGNMAVASGWMARAETLLGGTDECAGHGWLTLDRAPFTDDAAERQRLAAAALAIARRFGDVDLEYDALALLGESYVAAGRVTEGMQLIDEAMAAVSAGEVVGIVPVGDICCRLLSACETTLDIARAEQWMSVATRFGAWSDFVSPVCRYSLRGNSDRRLPLARGRGGAPGRNPHLREQLSRDALVAAGQARRPSRQAGSAR